jgi:hypothetical protein
MNPHTNWTAALACFLLAASATTAQEKKSDSHENVLVQLEVLDLTDGLPGASSNSRVPVGGRFGKETTTEKDSRGKLLYMRTIDGQCRWLAGNAIEVSLEISENDVKRTERIRLENFEPKTIVLREDPALGWREVLRLIPVFAPALVRKGPLVSPAPLAYESRPFKVTTIGDCAATQ